MSPIVASLVRHFGMLTGVSDVPISIDVATIGLSLREVVKRVDDPFVPLRMTCRLHCGVTNDSSTDLSPVRRGLAIFSPSAQLTLPSILLRRIWVCCILSEAP